MKRRLFGHEREIQSWRSITLTTHRVIHFDAERGFESSTSILLPHLQATKIARSHEPKYAVLAAGLGLLGLYFIAAHESAGALIALLLAFVLAAIYFGSRRAMLSLAAGSVSIEIPIPASAPMRQQARAFIDTVEDAAGRWPHGGAEPAQTARG